MKKVQDTEFPRKSSCGYTCGMSRPQLLVLIGIFVTVSPFIGLPLSVLRWALPVVGLVTLAIGVTLRPAPKPSPAVAYDPSQNAA